jgi:hypothetical protein
MYRTGHPYLSLFLSRSSLLNLHFLVPLAAPASSAPISGRGSTIYFALRERFPSLVFCSRASVVATITLSSVVGLSTPWADAWPGSLSTRLLCTSIIPIPSSLSLFPATPLMGIIPPFLGDRSLFYSSSILVSTCP